MSIELSNHQSDLETITLYGHAECPHVQRTCALLDKNGIAFQYIDIRLNEAGRLHVREINQGNESVPTLIFSDGSTLTEPSTKALYSKLVSIGYPCQITRWKNLFEDLIDRIRVLQFHIPHW